MRFLILSGMLFWAISGHAQTDLQKANTCPEIPADKFMAFYQEHGFTIGTITQNGEALPDIFEMYPNIDITNIDPIALGILPGETHKHFRLGNSGNVIIFFSKKKTRDLYERYLLISKN
ncbi:MAG: hypothetical protein NWR73_07860 [Flavobacteriales bacterium]|jgi:hypothetical protein|nr:hypothetical protein [Flavobacteriales bacterium]